MKKQNNGKPPVDLGSILIRIAAVLFILTMISIYLLGGLFARYASGGQGADSARVAGFNVVVDSKEVNYSVASDDPGRITITLNNQSEVAVAYKIRVKILSQLPPQRLKVTWVDPDGNADISDNREIISEEPGDPPETNYEMTFAETEYIAVGGTDECTLHFTAVDWKHITASETGESASVDLEVAVYVDIVQVD